MSETLQFDFSISCSLGSVHTCLHLNVWDCRTNNFLVLETV